MANEDKSSTMPAQDLVIDETIRPSTYSNFLFNVVVGILGWILTMAVFLPLKNVTGMEYYYQVIWERGPIQYLELIAGWFVVGHLIQKARQLKKQKEFLYANPIDPNMDFSYDEEVTGLRRRLRAVPGFEDSILLTRADRLLSQWSSCRDVNQVGGWAQGDADGDADTAGASNVIPQAILGTVPMFGFIGTVQGLGQAVSGFASFVSGTTEMTQIKTALSVICANLGTAFDTTFLALVLALIIGIPFSNLVRKENEMLGEFGAYIQDNIIVRLPPPEPAAIKIENLEDSIDAAFRRYIPDPDRYDEVFSRAIDRAADVITEKFTLLTTSYEASIADMTNRIGASLAGVGDSVEASMRSVVSDVQRQDETMVATRRGIAQEESARLKSMLAEFHSQTTELTKSYHERASVLAESTREGLDRSVSASRELGLRLAEIRDTAAKIDQLLHLEESVEKGLAGLAASEQFRKTLDDLRSHLQTTDSLCKQISRPRVITLREEIAG